MTCFNFSHNNIWKQRRIVFDLMCTTWYFIKYIPSVYTWQHIELNLDKKRCSCFFSMFGVILFKKKWFTHCFSSYSVMFVLILYCQLFSDSTFSTMVLQGMTVSVQYLWFGCVLIGKSTNICRSPLSLCSIKLTANFTNMTWLNCKDRTVQGLKSTGH